MIAFHADAAVERLKNVFQHILAETTAGGASLALWYDEKLILSLHGGEASPGRVWQSDTPCLIWSASKGIAAAVTLHALQEKGISLTTRMAEVVKATG